MQQAAFQRALGNLRLNGRGMFSSGAGRRQGQHASTIGAADRLRRHRYAVRSRSGHCTGNRRPAAAGGRAAQGKALLIGSADWDTDPAILAASPLAGAVYPAVDDTGYLALKADYQARFGGSPHPLATIAYTAAILANAAPLAKSKPPYTSAELTTPAGSAAVTGCSASCPTAAANMP